MIDAIQLFETNVPAFAAFELVATPLLAKARSLGGAPSHAGVAIQRIVDASEWADLINRVPFPHVSQGGAYGEGKQANGWKIARVAFRAHDKVVAICQIQEQRIAGIRVASRVHRGPLFLDPGTDADLVIDIYRLLRKRWGSLLTGPLVIAPALLEGDKNREILRLAGYQRRHAPGWYSAHIDLKPSEEEIFASFDSTFRNRCRKAEKQGVELEVTNSPDAIDWLISRNRDRLSSLGIRSGDPAFYKAVAKAAGDDFFILRAMFHGEPVGGTALIRSGTMTEYNVGWHSPAARDLNLGNYLMWHAIREAKRRGASIFDVGGFGDTEGGFTRFKRGMNGSEYRLVEEHVSIDLRGVSRMITRLRSTRDALASKWRQAGRMSKIG